MEYRGIAQRGEGRGTQLGYPTANIPLEDAKLTGIYAAVVTLRGKEYFAAVYANQERKLLEAHLLDFWGELYGQELLFNLQKKIREAQQFDDTKQLKAAIAKDVQEVRKYFSVE